MAASNARRCCSKKRRSASVSLRGAGFGGAFLAGAFFAGAFFTAAFLAGAFLAGAFLAGAFFAGAFLAGAFFFAGVFLAGAFFAGAFFFATMRRPLRTRSDPTRQRRPPERVRMVCVAGGGVNQRRRKRPFRGSFSPCSKNACMASSCLALGSDDASLSSLTARRSSSRKLVSSIGSLAGSG